jgi:hypothetical protein
MSKRWSIGKQRNPGTHAVLLQGLFQTLVREPFMRCYRKGRMPPSIHRKWRMEPLMQCYCEGCLINPTFGNFNAVLPQELPTHHKGDGGLIRSLVE